MAPSKVYNLEKKRSTIVRNPYPRIKPIAQLGWEQFLVKIINPSTGKPYEQLDSKGREVEQPDGLGPIRHFVRTVIRFRDFNDKEYILTSGSVYGFNSFGEVVSCHIHRPESFIKTLFSSRRKYDENTQSFSDITTGIMNGKEVYTLPFNETNLDSIISNNIVNKNTPAAYIEKITERGRIELSNPCSFVVQNFNKEPRAVEGKTYEERLDRFRNLSWDTLFEFKYLKEEDGNNNNKNNKGPTNNTSSVYK